MPPFSVEQSAFIEINPSFSGFLRASTAGSTDSCRWLEKTSLACEDIYFAFLLAKSHSSNIMTFETPANENGRPALQQEYTYGTTRLKLYRIRRTQILPTTIESAWEFFSSPLNLPGITPPWLNLEVVSPDTGEMFPGMVICYRVTPLAGIPLTWITEITHFEKHRYFVDEQRFGPYRFWHHQHFFMPVGRGVEITDTVHYGFAFGPFGRLAHALIIRQKLAEIFDFRHNRLKALFHDS